MDEPETPAEAAHTEVHAAQEPASSSVVLAGFESSRVAEHMVASLGRDFRHKARTGTAVAFVITRNRDGSFKLRQSRVVTASGVVAAATTFTAAIRLGLMGMMSAFRGAKTVTHAARQRQSHVDQEVQRLAEVLDQLGPNAACVLFHCTDELAGRSVAEQASERGSDSWQGSRTEFLAVLDRLGENYDWMRPVVADPATKASKNRPSPRRPPTSD